MSEAVSNVINKGIPVNASMLLYPQDILNLCDDKKQAEDAIKDSVRVVLEYFKDKNVEKFTYTKTGESGDDMIDAISGATITTNAVTNAVDSALVYFQNELGGGSNE